MGGRDLCFLRLGLLGAEQLAPVAGGQNRAAEDGDAADDLHRAGHGAQKDEPEQHRQAEYEMFSAMPRAAPMTEMPL